MKITKTLFGTYQREEIYSYELENDNGLILKIMTFGATITSLTIPGEKEGERINLVCGFDRFGSYFTDEYIDNNPYFGSTIGRYCSLIKEAEYFLDGEEYLLSANCGDNHLNGGVLGFDKQIWSGNSFEEKDAVGVNLELISAGWEEGYPGKVKVSMKMTVNNNNEIRIDYKATTSRKTPLSFTNHSFFNLSGFKEDINNHVFRVYSNKIHELDDEGIGTGEILSIDGEHSASQTVRNIVDASKGQDDGFKNYYVFDNPDFQLTKVADVSDPTSRRSIEVFSMEPCLFFCT